ncbi:MAG: carboxypeptidase-like regulatory domain-containing protein, partial [Pyrinomonadaceae bacterium]
MNAHKYLIFFLLALILALGSTAFGQSDRGTITGTVTDQNGGVVPNAKVTATNIDSGEVRETTTGDEGNFTLPELKAALYRLTIEAAGFKTASINSIQLGVQTTRRADVKLEVGAITESITVSSDAPVLQTDTPVQQLNVTEKQVRELPLQV